MKLWVDNSQCIKQTTVSIIIISPSNVNKQSSVKLSAAPMLLFDLIKICTLALIIVLKRYDCNSILDISNILYYYIIIITPLYNVDYLFIHNLLYYIFKCE